MKVVRFMESSVGRGARVGAGLGLIGAGIALGGLGWTLAVIGLVPLAAGAFGVCLLAPLFHTALRHVSHG